MKRMLRILTVLLLAALLCAGCGAEKEEPQQVQTDYGVLTVPEEWKDAMTLTSTDSAAGTEAVFSAKQGEKEIPIFSVRFGEQEGNLIGYLRPEQGGSPVPVLVSVHDVGKDDEQLARMADSVNDVIRQIKAFPTFEEVSELEDQEGEVLVETQYGELKFSAKYAEYLNCTTEKTVSGEIVRFFTAIQGEDTLLYALHFGSGEGIPIGDIETNGSIIPVSYTVDYSQDSANLPEICASRIEAMMEDVNAAAEAARAMPGFQG